MLENLIQISIYAGYVNQKKLQKNYLIEIYVKNTFIKQMLVLTKRFV